MNYEDDARDVLFIDVEFLQEERASTESDPDYVTEFYEVPEVQIVEQAAMFGDGPEQVLYQVTLNPQEADGSASGIRAAWQHKGRLIAITAGLILEPPLTFVSLLLAAPGVLELVRVKLTPRASHLAWVLWWTYGSSGVFTEADAIEADRATTDPGNNGDVFYGTPLTETELKSAFEELRRVGAFTRTTKGGEAAWMWREECKFRTTKRL